MIASSSLLSRSSRTAVRLLTGGEAVAHAMRQIDPAVVPVYPITPQTPIIEAFARFVANGEATAEVINVESEHSAMSAAVGASAAGARTMTATASQGLALMIEVVYIAASMRLPIVMAVGNRTLSGPLNIHCDHSDIMLARDSGVVQLFAEDAQQAYDLTLLAVRLAEDAGIRLPVLVCLDGFTVTHSAEPVQLLDDGVARDFVGAYRPPWPLLDVTRPTTQGVLAMPEHYFEFKYQQITALEHVLEAWGPLSAEFRERSGRTHQLVEPYHLEDAEVAIVLLGSTAGTVRDVVDARRAAGERIGVLSICVYRPFPAREIARALQSVARVAVLDRSASPGTMPPLYSDVALALRATPMTVDSYVYGLGGRQLGLDDLNTLCDQLQAGHDAPESTYIGLRA